ncbi:hypothetical protein MTO96_024422 [Rhipicephalus appendiculatus]
MFLGPFRGASKAGAFVTLVAFFDIYAKHGLLTKDNKHKWISVQSMVGGYAVNVYCILYKDKSVDQLWFLVNLCDGEWSEYIEWPFSKKITLIITHLRNREKDIRLPMMTFISEHYYIKKPAPGTCNFPMHSKRVNWTDIELNGFIVNKTLYLNIEFE